MRTEGFSFIARVLLILAAGLIAGRPLPAQQKLYLPLPVSDGGREPISFMRPPYILHAAAGASPVGPPTTAFKPAQVRHAYGFDQIKNQGAGQMIGIVDAYDDPGIESDLAVFNKQFSLPACTTSNGCFRKVFASGHRPVANANWSFEIALDVEWAHAIAPQATIVLVEAASNSLSDLIAAADVAVRNGASVVSMSWTVGEFSGEVSMDNHFVSNGVTYLAASGDMGTGAAYPAASPDVIGVGGTSLTLDGNGNYLGETAWRGSGGGRSKFEHEPLFQALFGIPYDAPGLRGVPDVAYDGDPGTGFAIYNSLGMNGYRGWFQVGGTSAGAPQWAALIAIANSLRATAKKARLNGTDSRLYTLAKSGMDANFHGVTQGSNGGCGSTCNAQPGYDYITGLGTPKASALIAALVAQP